MSGGPRRSPDEAQGRNDPTTPARWIFRIPPGRTAAAHEFVTRGPKRSGSRTATAGFFDLENEVFYLGTMKRTVTKRIEAADPLIVPLSDIVAATSDGQTDLHAVERIIQALREHGRLGKGNQKEVEYRQRLQRAANMLRREALCEEFTDDQEEHAFELFSRLNKGGTSLSTGDVAAARLASAATRKIVEPMRLWSPNAKCALSA